MRDRSDERASQSINFLEESGLAHSVAQLGTFNRECQMVRENRQKFSRSAICRYSPDREQPDGRYIRAAGCVIARQRPGTALGFIFLSM